MFIAWAIPGSVARHHLHNPGTNIKGTNTFSGVQSGLLAGSRIGFKGEEALGNGLKAIFTLEYALDIDGNFGLGASASGLAARQQFVGLSSAKLGTVALGRQYAPGYVASANNDSFGGALFSPQSFLTSSGRQYHHPEQRRPLEQRDHLHQPELGRLHRQGDLLLR
jgi:predicted porin